MMFKTFACDYTLPKDLPSNGDVSERLFFSSITELLTY